MTTPDNFASPAPRRRFFTPGLILAAAFLAGAAVYFGGSDRGKKVDDQPVFTVRRGPLTISVTESGTIKAREQLIIKNEVEGRTTILSLVPEGTRVAKGDLLVELDASTLEDQKVDQEIKVLNADAAFVRARENLEVVKSKAESDIDKEALNLRFAEEDLKKYREGEFPRQVMEAEARVALAEEELQRTQEKVSWSKVLFGEKYLSQTELQADELSARKAELDLGLARADMDLLRNFTYRRELAQLESDVKQNTMSLERIRRERAADTVQATAELKAKEAELEQQKNRLGKIGNQIGKTRIHAPADGMVVYATSAKATWRGNVEPLDEGQEVRERQELIYLPTASSFLAEVNVHESSLKKISPGQPARLTVDALPGMSFAGTVVKIAPLPDAQSIFLNPDLKVYRTEITLDGDSRELRTGMSCRAEILIEQYENALFVPVQTVLRIQGAPSVYVKKDGGWEPKAVGIGLDNNRMVHVVDGLSEGEEVLLTPPLAAAEVNGEDFPAGKRPDLSSGREDGKPSAVGGERKKTRAEMSPEERAAMGERFRKRRDGGGDGEGGREGR